MTKVDHNHYFIELMQDLGVGLSSGAIVAARQTRGRDFVAELRGWLEQQHLATQVSGMKVTALGRVMITCTPLVIDKLQELDHPDVVGISLSASITPQQATQANRFAS